MFNSKTNEEIEGLEQEEVSLLKVTITNLLLADLSRQSLLVDKDNITRSCLIVKQMKK